MNSQIAFILACAVVLRAMFLSPLVHADKPLWELGAGAIAFRQPHYPGATQARNLVLPFPYIVYRGEKVKAGNGKVKGLLFDSKKLDVDISVGGSLPVSSTNNRLRKNMPDLDPIVELGPSIQWTLLNSTATDQHQQSLQLELPLRWANSIDSSHIEDRGWVSTPQLTLRQRSNSSRWRFSVGAVYATTQFQDYFYTVAPQFATSTRPAFKSDKGLMAYRSTLSYEKRIGNLVLGVHGAYYDLSDAKNLKSSLLARENNFSIGLRIAWILRKSKTMVSADY